MPIDTAFYTKTIGGFQYAFDTGDIAFGDAETKEVIKNVGTDFVKIPLRKRQVTFTIRGVNATQLQGLYTARDNSITQIATATAPLAGEDILIGSDTIYGALLLDVVAGAPFTVAGVPIVEQVTVRYDSQRYV